MHSNTEKESLKIINRTLTLMLLNISPNHTQIPLKNYFDYNVQPEHFEKILTTLELSTTSDI